MSKQEFAFQTLRLIDQQPNITLRELSEELDVSLGKAHYVLKALVQKGWVKLSDFQRSNNKKGYAYLLTPSGMAEKFKLTKHFLIRKQAEYLQLKQELEQLTNA